MEPREKRRTQADRTNAAQAILIEAAIAELSMRGYAKVTTASIASRARVTTGSLHYHFGNKDGLLMAVLDQLTKDALAMFQKLDDRTKDGISVGDALVGTLWSLYGSYRYWAVWEINMGFRSQPEKHKALVEHRLATHKRMLNEVITNPHISESTRVTLIELLPFILSSMRGIFLDTYYMDRDSTHLSEQLSALASLLNERLQGSAADTQKLTNREYRK
ncbi:TetR/AcrR family transcriptional regulator [Paralcaligenes ureilyticus]|uniref:TetR family transcriptional regulator n=1 Tax=Paralcaligenes ureilyticus TaxID=627131 RepID=A0A4V6NZH4_9BURK|nr:TetR/AcrR family transcriptional regulator [Paralcaligenes ureilyticus]TCT03078.1 TetR family transcriptional regulator [Paralcaligenes ureilyticus]